MNRRPSESFSNWMQSGGNPVTRAFLLINFLTFIVTFFTQRYDIWSWMTFSSPDWGFRPWSLITYPLVASGSILCLLFSWIWLWFIGSSMERAWGSFRFSVFFFAISAITALFFWAGAVILGAFAGLGGLVMPLAALTIAWCMLNPDQTIMFYFILPLKARYLAWLTAALVYFYHGPLFGLFALGGILVTWLYIRYWRSGVIYDRGYRELPGRIIRIRRSALPRESVSSWWNPFSWIQAWQDRRRLKKLFEPPPFLKPDDDAPPPADSPK